MNNSFYLEIFGCEDPSPAEKKPEPVSLPWEDTSANAMAQWLKPAVYGSAVLNDALTKEILGEEINPVQVAPEPEPATPNALRDLAKLAGRLAKTRNSKKHRPAVRDIVDKIKNLAACEAIRHDPMWESLVTHATDYCCEAIHSEVGGI
jgi:hypothetical protein